MGNLRASASKRVRTVSTQLMTTKTTDTMDDPFSRFGIKHLSATSMLQFRNDPALGIVYLVLGVREAGSPAMHRGTAVDEAVGSLLTQSIEPDLNQLKRVASTKYRALIEDDPEHFNDRYVEQELRVLLRCLDVCFPLMRSWEKPSAYQQEIFLQIEGIEVPVRGFIDLLYPSEVRELKTTVKPKKEVTHDHAFQVSTYAMAIQQETGEWPEACVDYITPDSLQSYALDDVEANAREVVKTAFDIRTLLVTAKDETALRKSVQPDFSHWIWRYRPRSKRVAMEFFIRGV
jgi:CRISPR/Cas system-associated exonuclease Cas4 (RecB family)